MLNMGGLPIKCDEDTHLQGLGLAAYLQEMQGQPLWQDVDLRITEGNKKVTFRCHAPVLAAASPLFRDILGEVEEAAVVLMVGFTDAEVQQFLNLVYMNDQTERDVETELTVLVKHLCLMSDKSSAKSVKLENGVEDTELFGDDSYWQSHANSVVDRSSDEEEEERIKKCDSDEEYMPPNFKTECSEVKPKKIKQVCPICGQHKVKLEEHIRKQHSNVNPEKEQTDPPDPPEEVKKKPPTHTCQYCGSNVKELIRHVAKLHPEHWPEFDAQPRYNGKKRGRTREWPKKCDLCDKVVASKWHYEKHMRSHSKKGIPKTEGGLFICDVCGASFPSSAPLEAHVRSHRRDQACTVDGCTAMLSNRVELSEHLLLQHKLALPPRQRKESKMQAGPHLCTLCGRGFKTVSGFSHHSKVVHGDKQDPATNCPICGKVCVSPSQYKTHMALHKPPERPCPVCGKLFHTRYYVMRHVRASHISDEQKQFQCSLCHKGFGSEETLEGHMNWHNKLKPYKCRWCEHCYQNRSNCLAHERKTHSVEYSAKARDNPTTPGRTRIQVK